MLGWTLVFAAVSVSALLLSYGTEQEGARTMARALALVFAVATIFALTTPAPADEPTTDLTEGTRVEVELPAASGGRVEW